MPRDTDEKKTRKALRKLRKTAERAKAEGVELTDWEQEFVEGVDERLTKYGSAFNDLNLGAADDALSHAQSEILRQLDKKARGKSSGGLKTRKPLGSKKTGKTFTPNVRDIHADVTEPVQPEPPVKKSPDLSIVRASEMTPLVDTTETKNGSARPSGKPSPFRVIDGGKS